MFSNWFCLDFQAVLERELLGIYSDVTLPLLHICFSMEYQNIDFLCHILGINYILATLVLSHIRQVSPQKQQTKQTLSPVSSKFNQ